METEIRGQTLTLLPQRAIHWKQQSIVLLADLHLGKINHFRKSGIPVPTKANEHNIEILIGLLQQLKPQRVICVGDLFHSHYNPEWEVFGEVVKHFNSVSFELVIGNHDVMSEHQYHRKGIQVYDELLIDNFIFTHHPMEVVPEQYYNLAGHIHPGVHLRGRGRQALTLPCFCFGANQGILPAFGMFTGLAAIRPKKDDKVFAIVEEKVMEINSQ